MPQSLLLATNNRYKALELRDVLGEIPFRLLTPAELELRVDIQESGDTMAENARLKATGLAATSGLLTLADDSGLEVDALGGEPGVRSQRYGGAGATPADQIALVLRRLRDVPAAARTARFRCALCLAEPAGVLGLVEGVCEGVIAPEPRGTGGFGYDPIFFLPELGRTMAELTPAEKNCLSHRARAAQALRPILERAAEREG